MKFSRSIIAASIALAALAGCSTNNDEAPHTFTEARFATYNLSFDRASYEDLVAEMELTHDKQSELIQRYKNKDTSLTDAEKATAKKVIQIRNVAETIQRTRPNVFLLAEFNNDGKGEDMRALNGFHDNYLAHIQNGQKPISFNYKQNIATNTGKPSGYDLDYKDGNTNKGNDAWGFGNYHGQYAFAVFSQFKIDENNIRTFQNFKWKDMSGETNLKIVTCDDPKNKPIPDGKSCGDSWYSEQAWEQFPLSSKNHADIPLIINTPSGEQTIHFLVSHPAPPIFDNAANHNRERNRAELKFWNDYIASENYFYDDKGAHGGLPANSKFVIAGDLNADSLQGDGDRRTISDLLNNSHVNLEATVGGYAATSKGGPECLLEQQFCKQDNKATLYPEYITSTSGLRLDYVIPSANLEVTKSGVFWPASQEKGNHLVHDDSLKDTSGNKYGDKHGIAKNVSSDHRMVWMDFDLTK